MFAPKRVPLPVRDVRAPDFADLCTDFFPALLSLVFLPCLIPCKASAFRSFNNVFFIPNMVLSVCMYMFIPRSTEPTLPYPLPK